MMKRYRKSTPYLITILVNCLLFAAVIVLMSYVQQLLRSDVRISLSEIVSQNKDVISSKLMLEMNNLDMVAKQLSERITLSGEDGNEAIEQIFLNYAEQAEDPMLCWSDKEGNAIYGSGDRVSIRGRRYFQLALQGKQNISERTISRITGEDIFVISVPLLHNDQIIGTVQKQYTPEEVYEICSVSLFSQQGSMYIINSDGYILVSSQRSSYTSEQSNFYRKVYLTDPEASKELEDNIRANKSGFIESKIDGEEVFSAYTPVAQVHDWYLITSINTAAVIPNASIVIKLFYALLTLVVVTFAATMLYHLWIKDKQQNQLERLAFVDEVTQGNSYQWFGLEVQRLLAQHPSHPHAILVFDIDNFKYINRFYGFNVGDEILREVCSVYTARLQPGERMARVSADHFVLLLDNSAPDRAEQIFSPELVVGEVKVYFSAGIYPVRDVQESLNLMVDKATLASHMAKGRRFKKVEVFSTEYDAEVTRNEDVKRRVEQALSDDEIIPFFQPKVDIYTDKLVGAEALARWITKEGKMIFPDEFIPVCERSGLITLIDWAIFEQTLRFQRENMDRGVQCVPISVNFSRTHLLSEEFVGTLREKLQQYQVPPHLIEIELTETVIFDNAGSINDFINELHSIGLTVSMDDFGLGYSSLHMLKDVDIDVLKIDKAFLQATANSERQQVIFGAIIQMARQLHIKTVVEGVETQENVEMMKHMDCVVAQGYFYSKPIAKAIFKKWCEEGRALT